MKKNGARDSIAVVGPGLTGLVLAAALLQQGEHVTLIGPKPKANDDKRTTAVLQPGIHMLERLGFWQDGAMAATPLSHLELVDGDFTLSFDAGEMGQAAFGYNIPNAALRQKLLDFLGQQKNLVWQESTLKNMARTKTGWLLSFVDKTQTAFSLVLGCDGRDSIVRDAAGFTITEKIEQQSALVTIVRAAQQHHNTSVEWYQKGGPLTLVPMPDNCFAVVWCDRPDIVQQRLQHDLPTLGTELTQLTQKRFGKLQWLQAPQAWKIRPFHAQHLVTEHVALLGEAAHVLPPIGAQGFNNSLHDIDALCHALQQARILGLPCHDHAILRRYESARLQPVRARYHATNKLNDLIRAQHPALRFMRRTGLRALQFDSALRRAVMGWSMGQTDKEKAA